MLNIGCLCMSLDLLVWLKMIWHFCHVISLYSFALYFQGKLSTVIFFIRFKNFKKFPYTRLISLHSLFCVQSKIAKPNLKASTFTTQNIWLFFIAALPTSFFQIFIYNYHNCQIVYNCIKKLFYYENPAGYLESGKIYCRIPISDYPANSLSGTSLVLIFRWEIR